MSASYSSKHGIVSRPSYELFMGFTDMRNLVQMLPEDKKQDVTATCDTLDVRMQGIGIGMKVARRVPYSLLEFEDNGAPFHFSVRMHFDPAGDDKTDFSLDVDADLNVMMKMMLGSKVQQALDQVVDGLVAVSEGRKPDIPGI